MMGTQHSATPIYDQVMTEVSRQRDSYIRDNNFIINNNPCDMLEIYINEKTHRILMKEIYNAGGVNPSACEYFHSGKLLGIPVYITRANVYGNMSEQGKSPPRIRVVKK